MGWDGGEHPGMHSFCKRTVRNKVLRETCPIPVGDGDFVVDCTISWLVALYHMKGLPCAKPVCLVCHQNQGMQFSFCMSY